MEEKILEIMEDIAEGSSTYDGDNLFDDGLLDSFQAVDLVAAFEEEFGIRIGAKYMVEDNFKTKEDIIALVKARMED